MNSPAPVTAFRRKSRNKPDDHVSACRRVGVSPKEIYDHRPQSPSVTSAPSVRCFPRCASFSHQVPRCSPIEFWPPTQSPSVTSVPSVRCFPRCASFSHQVPRCPPIEFWPPTPIPLRDLRALRAMLSPLGLLLAQVPRCHRKNFRHRPQSPSVTSVPSVRCFPRWASFSPRCHDVTDRIFGHRPQSPSVTSAPSVRCFPRWASFSPSRFSSTTSPVSHRPGSDWPSLWRAS